MDTSIIEDKIGLSCRFNAARKANLAKRAKKRLPSLAPIDEKQTIINQIAKPNIQKAFKAFKKRDIVRAINGKRKGIESVIIQDIVSQLYAIDWKTVK